MIFLGIIKTKTMFEPFLVKRSLKVKKIITICALAAILLSGFFVGQIPPAKAMILVASALKGHVSDVNTGQGLAGVHLILWNKLSIRTECPSYYRVAPYYCEVGKPFGYQTNTDSNGDYIFYEIYFYRAQLELIVESEYYEPQTIANPPLNVYDNPAVLNIQLTPKEPDPVILIPGITGSWQKHIVSGEWQIDPFLHTYDDLLDALRQAGYQDNADLFTFPYQWRQDNNITAMQLRDKIQEIKTLTGKNKVDIIGHSMGGLVARAYIQSNYYNNDVDQLIFLGTPQTGAVNSYVPWESGKNLEKGKADLLPQFLNAIFKLEAGYYGYDFDLFSYVRDRIKSVQQLLPIYNYLIDNDSGITRPYYDNYPRNEFLENLNQPAEVAKLKQRVKITNFVSDLGTESTVEYLRVAPYGGTDGKWQNGYPDGYDNIFGDHGLVMGQGDETVPLKSAADLDGYPFILSTNVKHGSLPTEKQKEVIFALTGRMPATMVRKTIFNDSLTLTKFLLVKLFSPIDVQVIGPDGKKIGKNFDNNTEINEIPGAFYSGFDGPMEFVLIPNPKDGEYQINLQGTGSGEYKTELTYIDETREQTVAAEGVASPGQMVNYVSDLDQNNFDNWQIGPADANSPTIILNPNKEKYLKAEIINARMEDTESGLDKIEIKFDDQILPISFVSGATSTDLAIALKNYGFGAHTLTVLAQDKAGNTNNFQKNLEIYTDIDQTTADAKSIWYKNWGSRTVVSVSLGKIEKDYDELVKLTKDKEIAKIKKAIRLEINILTKILDGFLRVGLIKNEGHQILIDNLNYLLSKL